MTITGTGLGQTMVRHSEEPDVGDGTQEVTAVKSPEYVKTHLDFGDMGVADAMIMLTSEENGTRVIWSLDSDVREGVPTLMKPVSTYFGFTMDSMISKVYEKGLNNLKNLIEDFQ